MLVGSCVDKLYLMVFTSNLGNALSSGDFSIEVRVKGVTHKLTLPALAQATKQSGKGDLWKFNMSQFGFEFPCIHVDEIEEIAIEEDSNDGWNIDSVVSFVGDSDGGFQLSTIDMDVNQWIDGDSLATRTRFELSNVL